MKKKRSCLPQFQFYRLKFCCLAIVAYLGLLKVGLEQWLFFPGAVCCLVIFFCSHLRAFCYLAFPHVTSFFPMSPDSYACPHVTSCFLACFHLTSCTSDSYHQVTFCYHACFRVTSCFYLGYRLTYCLPLLPIQIF